MFRMIFLMYSVILHGVAVDHIYSWLLFNSLELVVILPGHCLALETSISVLNVLLKTVLCHSSIVRIISEYLKCTPECVIAFILQNTTFKDRHFRIGKVGTDLGGSNDIMPKQDRLVWSFFARFAIKSTYMLIINCCLPLLLISGMEVPHTTRATPR